MKRLILVMALLMINLAIGCGSGGGSPGDENDPATTSDEAQMTDETGNVDP